MKIAYYIHHTTIAAGGVFTYSIAILKQLIKSPEIEKIIIITSQNVSEKLNEFRNNDRLEIKVVDRNKLIINLMLKIWFALYTVILVIQNLVPAKAFSTKLKHSIARINPYHKIVESSEIDIFHVPIQHSPIHMIKTPVIITMHDIQEYHFPEYFSLIERLRRVIKNNMAIYDSNHIVVSFKHVKNDIIKHFNIQEEKISICPPPFADDWFLKKNESDWDEVQNKYDLKRKYILYPAATWVHKNHIKLIEAVKKIKDDGLEFNLICTGNKTVHYKLIFKKIEEFNLTEMVRFVGIIPEEDLISLYNNSSLVVIPTLYEAGSAPLYEAMRYQVPVICSNVTSLPDTIDNNEFIFNPNNVDEMASLMCKMLTDDNLRQKNISNSNDRMNYFRSQNYNYKFLKVYQTLKQ
jgi:glycosyltransferase involved in cell wall biosynthesis